MAKGCSFILLGIILLFAFPIVIGIAFGAFGLVMGILGGIFGLIFGLIGAVFGAIGSFFEAIFGDGHLFFHPFHWHVNGYMIIALVILFFAISKRGKK